ncbi:MAG: hypothetical protein NC429_14360 [Lachnospiraceae bacterium]|nr:hypothetical protein [Lachnospiraceae bacterium]
MFYIITAMYAEAHPFIARFQLKKDVSHTRFQVFQNRDADLCLVISGTGAVPASVAVSNLCTACKAGQNDFLLNAGVCAGIGSFHAPDMKFQSNPGSACSPSGRDTQNMPGTIFLCNKLTEQSTGKTFYPDILYRHDFPEAEIITGAKPYVKTDKEAMADADFYLYDMEAAAIYQAGAYYLGSHRMSFLKIISDSGKPEAVTSAQIERLIDGNMEQIADYIARIQTIVHSERQMAPFQEDNMPKELEKLCLDMHCSKTMAESVRQHIRYCILSGTDYHSVIREMYQSGQLPCKDKREGKQCLEELKQRLL